ncbi:MAG: BrnT family toxin [Hyphomicrobiales bacterium]|nr:BrnT family toxin [Hyphomicrobiales bacterium]
MPRAKGKSISATSNVSKHGARFEDARAVFRDPFALELIDDRQDYGDIRYILIGQSGRDILVVAYTDRNDRNRIISVRKAEPNERRFYHESNR